VTGLVSRHASSKQCPSAATRIPFGIGEQDHGADDPCRVSDLLCHGERLHSA
jgi:hypothetical protein